MSHCDSAPSVLQDGSVHAFTDQVEQTVEDPVTAGPEPAMLVFVGQPGPHGRNQPRSLLRELPDHEWIVSIDAGRTRHFAPGQDTRVVQTWPFVFGQHERGISKGPQTRLFIEMPSEQMLAGEGDFVCVLMKGRSDSFGSPSRGPSIGITRLVQHGVQRIASVERQQCRDVVGKTGRGRGTLQQVVDLLSSGSARSKPTLAEGKRRKNALDLRSIAAKVAS